MAHFLDIVKTLLRTTFTDLSFVKRWMVRLALLGIVGGAVLGVMQVGDGSGSSAEIDWAGLSLRTGTGFLGGFLVGAAGRLFFKVVLITGLILVGVGYLLHSLGWLELPWSSVGELSSAFGTALQRQTQEFREFLSGYLPAGGATAVGLGSGVTQKPRFDDDTD